MCMLRLELVGQRSGLRLGVLPMRCEFYRYVDSGLSGLRFKHLNSLKI